MRRWQVSRSISLCFAALVGQALLRGKSNSSGGLISVRFTIASDFVSSRRIQKKILDAVEKQGFTHHAIFAIKLSLEEALINAIKHGNRFDTHKKILVEAEITREEVRISVEDEGPGFLRLEVPDPTADENLEKCSGRGLLLMEAYMNHVEYSKGGRKISMVKRNEEDVLPRR